MTATDENSPGISSNRAGTGQKMSHTRGRGSAVDYSEGYSLLRDTGEIARFLPSVFRSLPLAMKYPTEILRQTGILIIGSSFIILWMEGLIAAEISLEAHYVLKQLGATSYVGVFSSYCDYACGQHVMWGWVLGAKVGCGLVAEIGSMRISEEIDAVKVMGLNAMGYIVGTRIMAIMIVTPFLYFVATGVMYVTNYIVNVIIFQSVSPGGYLSFHFQFATIQDIFTGMFLAVLIGFFIAVSATYYGYNSTGGAVGVGKNTAKSEVMALIITGVVGVLAGLLFFTGFETGPIAK